MACLKKTFIDEKERESGTHYPIFIICVSIVDIALLIYVIVYNEGLAPLSENPMAGPSNFTLIRNGAKYVPCMKATQEDFLQYTVTCPSTSSFTNQTCTYEEYLWYVCNVENLKGFPYQIYRFFTPIFLHVGIIHLITNLIAQLAVGIPLERTFGSIRIALIYILSGIGGNLLSAVGLPQNPSAGASGALYGILAVSIMNIIRNWKNLSKPWIQIIMNGGMAAVLLIIGIFVPIIDYMAHIGGLIVGILSGLLICPNLYWDICNFNDPTKPRLIIMGISSVFLLAFFLGGFIGFFRNTPTVFLTN